MEAIKRENLEEGMPVVTRMEIGVIKSIDSLTEGGSITFFRGNGDLSSRDEEWKFYPVTEHSIRAANVTTAVYEELKASFPRTRLAWPRIHQKFIKLFEDWCEASIEDYEDVEDAVSAFSRQIYREVNDVLETEVMDVLIFERECD